MTRVCWSRAKSGAPTYLPKRLVEPYVASGNLVALEFTNMSNQIRLWVDVVWLRDRPLGLGAQRFIELMRAARET
mgnify:CR=1 FL=1